MKGTEIKVIEPSTNPFDDFFFETHGGTKATWENEDEDLPEYEAMNDSESF